MTAIGCQSSHGSVALLLTTSGFQPLSNLAWMAGQLVNISHNRHIATTNIREPTGQSVPYFSCRLLRFLESTNYKHSRPPLVRRPPSPSTPLLLPLLSPPLPSRSWGIAMELGGIRWGSAGSKNAFPQRIPPLQQKGSACICDHFLCDGGIHSDLEIKNITEADNPFPQSPRVSVQGQNIATNSYTYQALEV